MSFFYNIMVLNYLIIINLAFFELLYSGGLLIIAFLFEYVGKYIPCQMCIWQRWPHIGVLFFCLLVISKEALLNFKLVFAFEISGLLAIIPTMCSLTTFSNRKSVKNLSAI